jgi:hypothetical protein
MLASSRRFDWSNFCVAALTQLAAADTQPRASNTELCCARVGGNTSARWMQRLYLWHEKEAREPIKSSPIPASPLSS